MKNKHTYVKCQCCDWRSAQHDYDESKDRCKQCNNTRMVIDPREILCNMCGETLCPIGTANEQYPHGLHNATVVGGYESYHLSDMSRYTFSFCEKCLRNMFIQCKIKPTINDTDFETRPWDPPLPDGSNHKWERDQKGYEYRVWKDNGGHHQAYVNGKCNFSKDCPNKAIYSQVEKHPDDGESGFSEDCSCEEHKSWQAYSNYKLVKFIPNILKPFL